MEISIAALTMLLTIVWFVVFWLVAGVMFAVIALIRFVKLNKARFSCLFTILSFVTAYGAAWMGVMAAVKGSSRCLARIDALYEAIPGTFVCAPQPVIFSAFLWFIFLLALGIGLMFFSRLADRPRTAPRQ